MRVEVGEEHSVCPVGITTLDHLQHKNFLPVDSGNTIYQDLSRSADSRPADCATEAGNPGDCLRIDPESCGQGNLKEGRGPVSRATNM